MGYKFPKANCKAGPDEGSILTSLSHYRCTIAGDGDGAGLNVNE